MNVMWECDKRVYVNSPDMPAPTMITVGVFAIAWAREEHKTIMAIREATKLLFSMVTDISLSFLYLI